MSVEQDEEMPLTDHIEELVRRTMVVLIVASIGMIAAFLFSEELLLHIWHNFMGDIEPRVYHPFGKVLTQLKLSGLLGLALAIPVLVYELFLFMKPGLYEHERRYFISIVPVSVILVFLGLAFSYLVALPILFNYFITYSDPVAEAGLGLMETFDLIVMLSLAMGVVFQIPLLMFMAIKMKVASRKWFEEKRIYVWGGCITIAALFSGSFDPTGFAAFMVAATMIMLFELTLALLNFTQRNKE